MPRLRELHKAYVIKRYAAFDTAKEIQTGLKEDFELDGVSLQAISYYNPDNTTDLADKWKTLFRETRDQVLKTLEDIPLGTPAGRIRAANATYLRARRNKNGALELNAIELADKIAGGANMKARSAGGSGDLTDEERVERMRAQMLEMDVRTAPPPDAPPNLKVMNG